MAIVSVKVKGDVAKVKDRLELMLEKHKLGFLDKYGKMGVEALSAATPKASGITADSWYYVIERSEGEVRLEWHNSNMAGIEGRYQIPVAVLIQYGHATRNGGYVTGIDYINPAMRPIFEQMAHKIHKEMEVCLG